MEEATPISPTPTQEAEARRVEPTPGLTLLTVLSLVSILWVGLLLTGVAWWFLRRLRRRFGPLHFLGAGVLWWFGRCTPPSTLAAFFGVPLFVRLGCLSRACAHCGTGYDAPTGPGWWGSGLYSDAASPALSSPSPAASTSRPRTPTVWSRHGFVCPIARCPRAARFSSRDCLANNRRRHKQPQCTPIRSSHAQTQVLKGRGTRVDHPTQPNILIGEGTRFVPPPCSQVRPPLSR